MSIVDRWLCYAVPEGLTEQCSSSKSCLIIWRSVCYVDDHTVQAFKRTGKNKLRYMYLYFCKDRVHTGLKSVLNLEGFLEKSLKIKSALKSTGKSLKNLEKSLNSTIFCRT